MKKTFLFALTKPARSSGGDRYEHGKKGDKEWMAFYLPQSMTREDGVPAAELEITIETFEE